MAAAAAAAAAAVEVSPFEAADTAESRNIVERMHRVSTRLNECLDLGVQD